MSGRRRRTLEIGLCEIYACALFAIFGIIGLRSSRQDGNTGLSGCRVLGYFILLNFSEYVRKILMSNCANQDRRTIYR